MSEIDRIKEELAQYRALFILLLATDFSIIAWLVVGFANLSLLYFVLGVVAFLSISVWAILTAWKLSKLLARLEEL